MKAIVCEKYGGPEVLKLKEIPKPVPQKNELLIKVFATTVTSGDCEIRRFDFPKLFWIPLRLAFGVFKPKKPVLGQELAGVVVAKGSQVKSFEKGDKVFGTTQTRFGAYAEYACLPDSYAIAKIPEGLYFSEAVSIPTGGLNALYFLNKSGIKEGDRILILGGGGTIGSYAIQLAKYFGAHVTAVDGKDKFELMQNLGADLVANYKSEKDMKDLEKLVATFDVVFDVVNKHSIFSCIKLLKPNGIYLMAIPGLYKALLGLWIELISNKRVFTGLATEHPHDLEYLADLVEKGIIQPAIDRKYPLEKLAKAHTYVEQGKKKGNVVIIINEPEEVSV
jgi:NADPH:quinone reductase-like Zn-dependent oxidoreductase